MARGHWHGPSGLNLLVKRHAQTESKEFKNVNPINGNQKWTGVPIFISGKALSTKSCEINKDGHYMSMKDQLNKKL